MFRIQTTCEAGTTLVPSQDRVSFFFAGTAMGSLLAVVSLGRVRERSESLEQIPLVFGKLPGLAL